MSKYQERVLEDDYPIYAGYLYVVDGQPMRSMVTTTALDFKNRLKAKEVKSCDIVGRKLQEAAL